MMDRTVHQAVKGRAKTSPVDHGRRPKRIRGNIDVTPDEVALALEMARQDRIDQDIRDYACRKQARA